MENEPKRKKPFVIEVDEHFEEVIKQLEAKNIAPAPVRKRARINAVGGERFRETRPALRRGLHPQDN